VTAYEDANLFMMCPALDRSALSELPPGYTVRSAMPADLPVWRAMPFDDAVTPETDAFMASYFAATYGDQQERFFAGTQFVVDERGRPVGTCLLWRAYGVFEAIHWLKVVPDHEGRGLDVEPERFPIYLHTQLGSYRAIKLYSDFGFDLISGGPLGRRTNDLEYCLPILRERMPPGAFASLRIREAPAEWRDFLATTTTEQF
jgi:GNAT superfamily N-acetyltransferase